jgi:hypothetical protein
MTKRRIYYIVAAAVVAVLIIYAAILLRIESKQRARREEERQKADQALTSMGGNMRFHVVEQTPDGLRNRLDLGPREKADNQNIHFLRGLSSVRTLDLTGADLSDSGLEPVRGLKGLEALQLANTKISDEGLKSLLVLQDLEAIDLSYTKAEGRSNLTAKAEEILKGFPKLKLVIAAGIPIANVNGVIVSKVPAPQSWVGLTYRPFLAPPPEATPTSSTAPAPAPAAPAPSTPTATVPAPTAPAASGS